METPAAPARTTVDSSSVTLHGLYAITDSKLLSEDSFGRSVEASLKGGASIIQYRDKSSDVKKRLRQAASVRSLCDQYRALCIINDDIELAQRIHADGVHLGRDDTDLVEARQRLGDQAIIGVSCYDDIDRAIQAEKDSADYIAFGSMFASVTKPDATVASNGIIRRAKQLLDIPVCAIGGITEDNIAVLTAEDVDMVAVISHLFASEDIEAAAYRLSRSFT